jgi:hypothetical protein
MERRINVSEEDKPEIFFLEALDSGATDSEKKRIAESFGRERSGGVGASLGVFCSHDSGSKIADHWSK